MKKHPTISNQCVEETWQSISGMTDRMEAALLSRRFSESQPALANYIFSFTESLSENAIELAYYLGLVLWQCYERSSAKTLPQVQVALVEACHEKLDQQLLSFQGVDNRFIERRILYSEDYSQPAILRYIVEAIYDEPQDPDDPDHVQLGDDEKGSLFITLRVVADALDSAVFPDP